MGWGQFKPLLAEATVAALEPIQQRYKAFMDDRSQLEAVLRNGRERASAVAEANVQRVRRSMGFLSPS